MKAIDLKLTMFVLLLLLEKKKKGSLINQEYVTTVNSKSSNVF
jgi:hypothetical protein